MAKFPTDDVLGVDQKSKPQWVGDPVFLIPSRCNDQFNTHRVFHRDIPGRVIAEFYGENAGVMAARFCELFGEKTGGGKGDV